MGHKATATPLPEPVRSAQSFPRGGRGRGRAAGRARAAGEAGGRLYCLPAPSSASRASPRVAGEPPGPPGGGLFIARAARASRSLARLTRPLTRLAAGLRAGPATKGPCVCSCRRCRRGPGAGEGAGRPLPSRLPPPATPRKGTGLFCPWPGPGPRRRLRLPLLYF